MKKSAIIGLAAGLTAVFIIIFILYKQAMDVYAIEEPITANAADCDGDLVFAVIGDIGVDEQPEADVADLVLGWHPAFIATVGDNNNPDGAADTIDRNIGQYYHAYIHPYLGDFGEGAEQPRFFPALGNHDLKTDNGQPHFDYFSLPFDEALSGNERYYDVVWEDVHLFILNSDPSEVNGRSVDSVQAQWLRAQLAASTARWKIVLMHHTPYTSSLKRNSDKEIQWPYAEWGATAVFSGHDHLYERLQADGIPYFVNGAGGKELNPVGPPVDESIVRYNQDHGAMRIQANDACINFSFFNRQEELIDSYTVKTE